MVEGLGPDETQQPARAKLYGANSPDVFCRKIRRYNKRRALWGLFFIFYDKKVQMYLKNIQKI